MKRKPNLVFIMADDHAGYVLGADGNPQARTPNLDWLAQQGTYFAQHYCSSPICTASRQSILTGLLPHAVGVTVLYTPLDEKDQTLADILRDNGYDTAVFGKMHFNSEVYPGIHGFDETLLEDEYTTKLIPQAVRDAPPPDYPHRPAYRPWKSAARVWLNADYLPGSKHDARMASTLLAERAQEYLESHKDKPFAVWVSFKEPHSPFNFPPEWSGQFRPEDFQAPQVGPEDAGQIPLIFRDLTEAQKRSAIASYYTSVNYLDRNIGRVLDKLDALNLSSDTLVIYLPDHGYCLGHHGRFEKHCGYDQALRVPLIIRLPGQETGTKTVHDLTESLDIMPTLLELLGLPKPPQLQGQSLANYLTGATPATPREWIFSEYLPNEEVYLRTKDHKFIFCSGQRARNDGYITDNPTPGPYTRLYDLRTDPGEFRDVSAAHPELVERFSKLLLERFRQTHPEANQEPAGLNLTEALSWYACPRDAEYARP